MKRLATMALLLCFALPVMAQNKKEEERVQLARDRYAAGLENIAINKQYEQDEIPAVNYTSVVRKQNWAGGGQSVDKMEFYYNEIEDDMEPYPVGYSLVLVRRNYNVGSTDHFEEFVYDNEGRPLFWFSRYGSAKDNMTELRGYYDANGKLIRSICKKSDPSGEMKTSELDEDMEYAFSTVFDHFIALNAAFQAIYSVNP